MTINGAFKIRSCDIVYHFQSLQVKVRYAAAFLADKMIMRMDVAIETIGTVSCAQFINFAQFC